MRLDKCQRELIAAAFAKGPGTTPAPPSPVDFDFELTWEDVALLVGFGLMALAGVILSASVFAHIILTLAL